MHLNQPCFKQTQDYLNGHCILVVLVGGECLTLLGGNNSVTSDELGHDASHSLNTHRQSCHIQQQHLIGLQKTVNSEAA